MKCKRGSRRHLEEEGFEIYPRVSRSPGLGRAGLWKGEDPTPSLLPGPGKGNPRGWAVCAPSPLHVCHPLPFTPYFVNKRASWCLGGKALRKQQKIITPYKWNAQLPRPKIKIKHILKEHTFNTHKNKCTCQACISLSWLLIYFPPSSSSLWHTCLHIEKLLKQRVLERGARHKANKEIGDRQEAYQTRLYYSQCFSEKSSLMGILSVIFSASDTCCLSLTHLKGNCIFMTA